MSRPRRASAREPEAPPKTRSRTRSARAHGPADERRSAADDVASAAETAAAAEAGMIKGLARGASRIVAQAASILEEELATGIDAAKQIEERFVNVADMRSANPDEVMARFRDDAHQVVDIVLDLINVPTRSLGDWAQRVVSIRPDDGKTPTAAPAEAPTIAVPSALRPGASAEVPLSLENDGDKILARHVNFDPATITIAPHERESVTVSISVPKGTVPGLYSGLVLASKLDRLRAVLVVDVE